MSFSTIKEFLPIRRDGSWISETLLFLPWLGEWVDDPDLPEISSVFWFESVVRRESMRIHISQMIVANDIFFNVNVVVTPHRGFGQTEIFHSNIKRISLVADNNYPRGHTNSLALRFFDDIDDENTSYFLTVWRSGKYEVISL